MDLGLKGRRVVVTGSSAGIGFGIARGFVGEGARVLISGRDPTKLASAIRSLRTKPTHCRPFAGDLTLTDEMRRLVRAAERAWGGIDVLVLNLGSGGGKPDLAADLPEWERLLRLNLVAAAEMMRVAEPVLARGRDPAVVMVGSIAGLEALGAPWAYGAAKAGLRFLAKQAARHLAAKSIRVNLVAPGNIFFRGGTWDRKTKEDRDGVKAMLRREVPAGRFGTLKEVGAAVLFLASPVSGFTTGACLAVDGGQTRH